MLADKNPPLALLPKFKVVPYSTTGGGGVSAAGIWEERMKKEKRQKGECV